jgi:hypothetical protein
MNQKLFLYASDGRLLLETDVKCDLSQIELPDNYQGVFIMISINQEGLRKKWVLLSLF